MQIIRLIRIMRTVFRLRKLIAVGVLLEMIIRKSRSKTTKKKSKRGSDDFMQETNQALVRFARQINDHAMTLKKRVQQ